MLTTDGVLKSYLYAKGQLGDTCGLQYTRNHCCDYLLGFRSAQTEGTTGQLGDTCGRQYTRNQCCDYLLALTSFKTCSYMRINVDWKQGSGSSKSSSFHLMATLQKLRHFRYFHDMTFIFSSDSVALVIIILLLATRKTLKPIFLTFKTHAIHSFE